MEKEGKYLYCIIDLSETKKFWLLSKLEKFWPFSKLKKLGKGRTFGRLGIGGRGDVLHTICRNSIAVVVSDSPVKRYTTTIDNVFAHEASIEAAMKAHTILPFRFNTIAKSEEVVKRILAKEYETFTNSLKEVEGKKELGVKAMFKERVVYKDILEKYDNVRKLKEKIAPIPPVKTYKQRIEIGRMVEAALKKEKELYKQKFLSALSPLAAKIKVNEPYGERTFLNGAFFVSEDKESVFSQQIDELDLKYGDKVKIKYVTVVPPFNFVNLKINTEDY